MAVALWDIDNFDDPLVVSAAGAQVTPVVADSHGSEFGVAWIDQATNAITVNFYDERGCRTPCALRSR